MRATPIKILIATSDKSCQGDILDASSPLAQSAAVTCLTTSHELLESAKDQSIDVIVAAHELDDGTVFDVLEHLLKPIPVIVLVNPGEAHIALRAVKAGASDYLIIDSHGDYIKLLPDVIERTLERPQAAIAQNHQMEAIISGSNDLIVMYDREYRYAVTNDKHLEIWGYEHHELIGKHIADVLGQEFFENRAKPNLDRCFTGETIRYQTPVCHNE